jgi:hypothetical protein
MDTVCERCQRRSGHYPETDALMEFASALQGGMPVGAHELPYHTWVALGLIRGRMGM